MRQLALLACCLLFACSTTKTTTEQNAPPSSAITVKEKDPIAKKVNGMTANPGFFNFYWNEKDGKIWLEIDKFDTEFLYVNSLSAGVGSNDIGLDRGQLGDERVVKFVRTGNKVLLTQINLDYRANSDNPDERLAVEEAFAQSVLWGFTIGAEHDGRLLVDATSFILRDAHDVIGRLRQRKQGNYRLEESRSAMYLPRTQKFSKKYRSSKPRSPSLAIRKEHGFAA